MRWRHSGSALSVAAVALLAGCSGGDAPAAAGAEPPPGFSASVLQYSHDMVAERVVVKVSNASDQAFTVERLEVVAPGFDDIGPVDFGTVVPPGRAFDLRMSYGSPDCEEPASADELSVEVSFADLPGPVTVAIEDGAELLQRIHDQTCAAAKVRAVVPLSWGPRWTTRGAGNQLTAVGTLVVGPVADGHEVQLAGFNPTTLFQVELPDPPTSLAAGERAEVVAHLRPSRCDAHALGESPQGYEFLLRVNLVGSDMEALVPVLPSEDAKRYLQDYWVQRCGLR